MDQVQNAMNRTVLWYIVMIFIIMAAIASVLILSKKREDLLIFAVALGVVLGFIIFTSFVPFMKDYFNNSIVETEGIYTNSLAGKSKTPSSMMGVYSVSLETEDEKISLTTVPMSGANFPSGKFFVKAYYTENSKRLVYIEVLADYA